MPSRRSFSKQVFFVLLVLSAVTAACGSDSSANEPTQPSGDQLTAEQILALAESATSSAVAYRMDSQYVIDVADMERQTADITVEWTSPDRMRQLQQSDSEDDRGAFGIIRIGDISFLGWGASIDDIEWEESRPVEDADNERVSPLTAYGLSEAEITGEEVINGTPVYRLEGIPTVAAKIEENDMTVIESSQTSYVAVSDFRTVRVETHIAYEMPDDDPGGPATRLNDVTMEMDVTYFADPIEIEPPDSYVPMNDPNDSAPWTPTPVIPTPTATTAPDPMATSTPTPVPGLDTFAPDDPNRHIPFYVYDKPYYDKLEIGENIIVDYPKCNSRNSIIDRWANIVIFYMPDGSRAASGVWIDAIVVNPGETPVPATPRVGAEEFVSLVYHSDEGKAAIEAVLNDPDTMRHIREYADRDVRCPEELDTFTGHTFKDLPGNEKLEIDSDTIVRFEPCGAESPTLAAPILIAHLPSESMIAITPGETGYLTLWSGSSDSHSYLRSFRDDEHLMRQLEAMAPKEARCG